MVYQRKLAAYIDEKVAMLRTAGADELEVVEVAAAIVPLLANEFQLDQFLGDLRVDLKPRFLLHFRTSGSSRLRALGEEVVLKVYGDQPRGEGPMMSEWHARGLAVPKVYSGELQGCSWLVAQFLELAPLVFDLGTTEGVLDLTLELAGLAPAMHRPAEGLRRFLRDLDRVIVPRWDKAVEVLRAHGHCVPERWRSRAAEAYSASPRMPLHGDLGLPNVARDGKGCLIVYDPSALFGPVEFDAARWAARLAGTSLPPREVLAAWESEDVTSAGHAHDLLAAECVLEAGAAVATDPDGRADARVRCLLTEAGRILK